VVGNTRTADSAADDYDRGRSRESPHPPRLLVDQYSV
jgi:hypothetical protein